MAITDQDWIATRKWAVERMQTYPGDTSYQNQYFQATDELVVYAVTGKYPDNATFVGLPPNPAVATAQTTSISNANASGGTVTPAPAA